MKWLRQVKFAVSGKSERHVVLGVKHPIPEAQLNGLQLAQADNDFYVDWYELASVQVNDLVATPAPRVVWLQSWWDTPAGKLKKLIESLRSLWPSAKIIYLDWFAPTDLRHRFLVELCDVYVKKNLLTDLQAYASGFCDTNLVDYEIKFDESLKAQCHDGIDPALVRDKVRVGWSFATQKRLIALLNKRCSPEAERSIALHCRMAAPKEIKDWYAHMRMRAFNAVKELNFDGVVAESKSLPWPKYIDELKNSAMCFSPFGYGEVCWRDFEAIAAGALLIKPDMSHMTSVPNIYQPRHTYVNVSWDFEDLEEVCLYYLANKSERVRLVINAQQDWSRYLTSEHASAVRAIYS